MSRSTPSSPAKRKPERSSSSVSMPTCWPTVQGLPPEYMYVVAPWSEFQPQQYRFADYAAYFRKVKRALLDGHGRAGDR